MSVRVKTATLLALSVILIAALLYVIMVTRVKLSIEEEAHLRARAERDSIYWQIKERQAGIEQSVNSIVSEAEMHLDPTRKESVYLESFLTEHEEDLLHTITETADVIGGYIYLDPDLFDDVHYRWYGWENGEYVPITDDRASHPDYLRRSGPLLNDNVSVAFYDEPVRSAAPVWTVSYDDPIINRHIISYASPIYINRTFMGVAGMDVDPAGLAQIVSSSLRSQEHDAFIMEKDGTFAIPPRNPAAIGQQQLRAITGEEGIVETPSSLLSYRLLEEESYLVLVIPKHEAFAMLYALQLEFLMVTAVLTIVMAGLGFMLADSIRSGDA